MIYITQLIYIKPGKEKVFDEFEQIAIPIISKYNGKLLLRIRPEANSFIEGSMDHPYEVHVVEFATRKDFENFKTDDDRKKALHLKDQAVSRIVMIEGLAS